MIISHKCFHLQTQTWPSTILAVSHDRAFLTAICTDLIHMHSQKLDCYRGNYEVLVILYSYSKGATSHWRRLDDTHPQIIQCILLYIVTLAWVLHFMNISCCILLYLRTWHFIPLFLTFCPSPSPLWPFVLPPLPFDPLSLPLSPLTLWPLSPPSSHTSLLPEFSTDQRGEVKEPAEGIRSTAAVQTTPSGSRRQLTLILSTCKHQNSCKSLGTRLVVGERREGWTGIFSHMRVMC